MLLFIESTDFLVGFFQSNYSAAPNIAPAIPLRFLPQQEVTQCWLWGNSLLPLSLSCMSDIYRFLSWLLQEYRQTSQVSSLSETSTESQSAQNTAANQNIRMGFESPPGRHFQTWADRSPRAETSTSMDGDGKEDNRVIFSYMFIHCCMEIVNPLKKIPVLLSAGKWWSWWPISSIRFFWSWTWQGNRF